MLYICATLLSQDRNLLDNSSGIAASMKEQKCAAVKFLVEAGVK